MTATKQITFEGREYTVPVWVEWVARDDNLDICGYELCPIEGGDIWIARNGLFCLIETAIFNAEWCNSLTKV